MQDGALLERAPGPATARKPKTTAASCGSTASASGTRGTFFDRIAPRMEASIIEFRSKRASQPPSPTASLDAEIDAIDRRLRTLRELDAMIGIATLLATGTHAARLQADLAANANERTALDLRQLRLRRERNTILRNAP